MAGGTVTAADAAVVVVLDCMEWTGLVCSRNRGSRELKTASRECVRFQRTSGDLISVCKLVQAVDRPAGANTHKVKPLGTTV